MSTEAAQKVFGSRAYAITEDRQYVLDARGMGQLTVISGPGATTRVSRVDEHDADEHTDGDANSFLVASEERVTLAVDWPFYLISVTGGECRCALV